MGVHHRDRVGASIPISGRVNEEDLRFVTFDVVKDCLRSRFSPPFVVGGVYVSWDGINGY